MRHKIIASVLSLIGPGLGQFYNRDVKNGFYFLVGSTTIFIVQLIYFSRKLTPHLPNPATDRLNQEQLITLSTDIIHQNRFFFNFTTLLFLAVWAWAITHAYFNAKDTAPVDETGGDDEDDTTGAS